MRRHRKLVQNIAVLTTVLLLFLLFSAFLFGRWTKQSGPLEEATFVVIPKGSGSRQVASILEEAGVIDMPYVFMVKGRMSGLDKRLRAGEYQFPPKVSMIDAMEKIAKGEIYYHRITLPEGKTTGQFLLLIEANPNLSGDISIEATEGELLPETYSFERGMQRDEIVKQAKDAMAKVKDKAWRNRMPDMPLKSVEEMMVLASIIEKETAVPAERGTVASVFVNRLKKRMKLQTDPTVIYAITNGSYELGRGLKKADLSVDSPYNTYKHYGLPPKPICNPSKESIWAAVNPEFSDYLYFVADGKGGHNFSNNLEEHNNNVRSWVKDLKAKKQTKAE